MNKSLSLLVAAATLALANTTLAPIAEAGGGTRLQFGYPLGSFVARDCSSCGSSSSYQHSNNYAAKKAAAQRAAVAEAKAEARRKAIAEAKAEARRNAIAEAKAEARRNAIAEAKAEARREAVAESKAEARRERLAEARRKAKPAKDKADEQEVAKVEEIAPETEVKQESEVSVGTPQVVLSQPNTAATDAGKPKVEQVAAVPVTVETKPAPKKAAAPLKPLDCKKFVPSAGLTITVPCT